MTKRLALYGSTGQTRNVAKVGDKGKTPQSLVARMPSPEIAAKVGSVPPITGAGTRRVLRRNARD